MSSRAEGEQERRKREERRDSQARERVQGKPPAETHIGPEGKSGQVWHSPHGEPIGRFHCEGPEHGLAAVSRGERRVLSAHGPSSPLRIQYTAVEELPEVHGSVVSSQSWGP